MTLQTASLFVFACLNLLIFFRALHFVKKGGFYTNTHWLVPIGIFVWGDALVIAPFWVLMSILGLWLTPLNILRFVLLFYAIRSAYEVVYWINHQVAQRDYMPPFLQRFAWLKPNDAAIVYQLLTMVQVVLSLGLLFLTFQLGWPWRLIDSKIKSSKDWWPKRLWII